MITLALLALPLSAAVIQEDGALLDADLRDLLHEELSGELAKEHVYEITRHHRIQGSRGYRDSAQWLLEELREYDFQDETAWIESFDSDGRVTYQTWQSPSGWDIDTAELRMVKPYDERIVGYPEIAMSVMTYCNAGSGEAPVVWVGPGTADAHYAGLDVAGKVVLATGYGGEVHRRAVIERGAAFVVSYLDDWRAKEYPDMLAYTGMWPRTEELEQVTFGFNLSQRQGDKLRRLVEAGTEVVLNGRVTGKGLEPFFMDVVVAEIRGSKAPEEVIYFCAHLDHPKESANDNASGSAALLDIARGLRKLIDEGRMTPPGRTLRFIWVPEFYGTMAYLDRHPELAGHALGGHVLAAINMDMVGENTELLHCRLELTRNPASVPSVLDDVVENMAEMVDRMDVRTPRGSLSAFNYRVTPFAPGSDHMIFIDRKVPSMMFWHSPDYTHHTSEDTPDKVDPVEIERCELIGAGAALFLANLDESQAQDLLWLSTAKAAGRLGEAARSAIASVTSAPAEDLARTWAEAASALEHSAAWQQQALQSVLDFRHHDHDLEESVELACSQLDLQASYHSRALHAAARARGGPTQPAPVADSDERVPQRLTRGPLSFGLPELELPADRAAWYAGNPAALGRNERFELVNFIDGERTAGAIRDALSAEFGPIEAAAVSRFLDDLVTIGVVEWLGR